MFGWQCACVHPFWNYLSCLLNSCFAITASLSLVSCICLLSLCYSVLDSRKKFHTNRSSKFESLEDSNWFQSTLNGISARDYTYVLLQNCYEKQIAFNVLENINHVPLFIHKLLNSYVIWYQKYWEIVLIADCLETISMEVLFCCLFTPNFVLLIQKGSHKHLTY